MSHTVTITRTTAVSSGGSSGVYVNCGYLSTMPGLLKLAQLVSKNVFYILKRRFSARNVRYM